jgi:hypothetical protein
VAQESVEVSEVEEEAGSTAQLVGTLEVDDRVFVAMGLGGEATRGEARTRLLICANG